MDLDNNGFALLRQLREKKVNQKLEYKKLKNYLELKARDKGIPVSGHFELTPLCNFNCRMCYVHLEPNQMKGQPVLSVETWKNLMHQAWEAGMLSVNLTGGECLAYPGFEELYLFLHSLGCEVGVLTNGYLLDEEKIQFFKEHPPAAIQVTLYGWNDDVYERVTGQRAFSIVVNNIRRAVETELPVCISITPSSYLGEDLLETIRVAKQICDAVMINSAYSSPREETGRAGLQGDADIELYIRAYKYYDQLEGREPIEIEEKDLPPCGGPQQETSKCGFTCGGGRSSFSINWKGELKPCIEMEAIKAYPLKEGFATAWAKVNQAVNNWPRVSVCEGCVYNDICHNCASHVLQYAELGKQPYRLCEQTRELVRNGRFRLPECK